VNTAVITALLACLTFTAAGPHLTRALPPPLAVRLLVPAALLAAATGVFVLGTVTFTWLGQLGEVAEFGTWSPRALHALSPIPPTVALICGALLIPLAAWTLLAEARTVRALWTAHRALGHLEHRTGSAIVVVDSDDLEAFTTPGLRGRIVVTRGILAALDPAGRRVLLAHERSHRTHRHTWWTLAADLAAAVNPLLRPTARAIRHATERWADEDAARGGDRRLVAATIAQVALLRAHQPASPAAMAAATGGQVPQRVTALLRPAPRMRAGHLGVLIALTLAVLLGAFAVERTGETLFEHAKHRAATAAHTASLPHH
jgi:Zn-dependent protease with chaperone function